MAKPCPQCQNSCSDAARFCTKCRFIFDSAPNPTCQRGHPMLPGATSCPMCQALEGGGRGDTVAENVGREKTQVDPSLQRGFGGGGAFPPPQPGGLGQPPAGAAGRSGTAVLGGGPPPPAVPGLGRPPAGVPPQGGPGSRSGTLVVSQQPGQAPSQAQAAPERKIVAVLVSYDIVPSGAVFPIRVGRNRIGRDPKNEISVPTDAAMSETNTYIHFYESSGSFVINDANSQNGTFVNGQNLEGDSIKLSNYATIRAGVTQFTLIIVNPPAAVVTPAAEV